MLIAAIEECRVADHLRMAPSSMDYIAPSVEDHSFVEHNSFMFDPILDGEASNMTDLELGFSNTIDPTLANSIARGLSEYSPNATRKTTVEELPSPATSYTFSENASPEVIDAPASKKTNNRATHNRISRKTPACLSCSKRKLKVCILKRKQ